MTAISTTNRFFNDYVYDPLKSLAISPISWAFAPAGRIAVDPIKVCSVAVLWPIFLPLTLTTSAIALCMASVAALLHGLSLFVAGVLDIGSDLVNSCSNATNYSF